MRVCICISGQARGDLSGFHDLRYQLNKLEKVAEVVVIFSLWRTVSSKVTGALNFAQMHRIFEENLAQVIPTSYYGQVLWDHFPSVYKNKIQLSHQGELEQLLKEIFPNAIVDIEDEILDLSFDRKVSDSNSKRMLYKRWRCNEIKRKCETDFSKKFDLVLVTRPDLDFDIQLEFLAGYADSEDTIFIPDSPKPNYQNDILAYGSSSVIDQYCSFFSKSLQDNWSNIHTDLYNHLENLHLKVCSPDIFLATGFRKEKLLSFDHVEGEDEFVDSLINMSDIMQIPEYDQSENSSPYSISKAVRCYQLALKSGDYMGALKFILNADISVDQNFNLTLGRGKFVYDAIVYCIRQIPLKDASEFNNLVKDFSPRKTLVTNIQKIQQLKSFSKLFESNKVRDLIRRREIDTILEINNVDSFENELACDLIGLAIDLEGSNLENAYKVMCIAKDIRPSGRFIERKIQEYSKVIDC